MSRPTDEDPLQFDVPEAGLPAEAEDDLRAIRSMRESLGPEQWQRLMFWERIAGWLAYLYSSIPLLLLATIWGTIRGDLHPIVFLRKSRLEWETGDWVFVSAWAAAFAATVLGGLGRLAVGAVLRRTAEEAKPPDMDTDEVVAHVDAAAFLAELRAQARESAEEQRQTREGDARLREVRAEGPLWWRLELSGAHLLWWVALILVLTHAYLRWPGGDLAGAAWGLLVSGIIFKALVGGLGYSVVAHSPQTRLAMLRYYRWWGRGIWPIVILAFFAFSGIGIYGANQAPPLAG